MSASFSRACLMSMMAVLFFLGSLFPAAAQDFRVRAAPEVIIPLADRDTYGLGGGASVVVDIDLFEYITPYAGLGLRFISPKELDNSLVLTSFGTGIGYFIYPVPRLKVGVSAGPGFYIGSYSQPEGTTMTGNIFLRAGVDAGYRVSPGLTVSAGVSWNDYRAQNGSLYKGISLSLVADIGLRSRTAEGRALLDSAESVPIFPILAADYQTAQFGSATIRNGESAEIRNVEIWFYAEGYSSGPVLCASVPYLPKNATFQAPLFAAFSDQLMTVTETVRISGEVRIVYELLGERRMAAAETTISVMHRNALTWDDPAILASFVNPNDPAVLETTKFIAGIVRSNTRPELDSNLQYALGIFEGLRLSNIAWVQDPQTPYAAMRVSPGTVDYVQYPYQTISYRSGDSDDLAVLFAAALESVGIPAALIPFNSEVFAAFQMSSGEAAARAMFTDTGNFIFVDGEAWVPLRITMLREGFLRAWNEGAKNVMEAELKVYGSGKDPAASGGGSSGRFIRLSEAWRRYPPAGVPGIPPVSVKPPEGQIVSAFNSVMSLVVSREVVPRAERMRASFGPDGGTGRQLNSLGILYARYGMYREALAEFQASAARGELRAGINIGNVAFLLGDYETAVEWYEKAMTDMPNEVSPVIGLARSYYELDLYEKADEYFGRASSIRPELADRYSYLSARLTGSEARASAAMDRLGDMLWDE